MNEKERLQLENELLMTCSKSQAINKYIDELEENSKLSELWCKSQQENQQLKEQLEYLRSGEYLNQLKFERNMLENIVQNMEVSKEDKEFIDMTHRNTELLEENQALKDRINKAIEYIDYIKIDNAYDNVLKEILKEDNKEK